MDTSWTYDEYRFDADKEISQVYSTALDGISQLSEHEDDDYSTDDEKFVRKLENKEVNGKRSDRNGNPFHSYSTPMHSRALKPQNRTKYSTINNQYDNLDDTDETFSDARSRIVPRTNGYQKHSKENHDTNRSGSLKHENDILSKNITSLNNKCTTISSNYEELEGKFHELFKVNEKNLEVIDKLQQKVRSLECKLKDEEYLKESAMKKANILESSVNSLENQIQEYSRTDFYSRTTESHQKVIESLKQKYDGELNSIRSEVDLLREKLQQKNDELATQSTAQDHANAEHMNRVIETTKKRLYKEMQEQKMEELIAIKDKNRSDLKAKFEKRICDIRDDWDEKLLEDVDKITRWLSDSVREDDMEPKPAPTNEIHFEALQQLCDYLNSYLKERENRIQIQVSEFRKTKRLLEDALVQSQMSSCNLTEVNVLEQLEVIKEENVRISQKLNKYKECYKALVKKHENEIESLKNEFKQIVAKSRPTV